MMRKWTQLLPFFVVAWIARRHGERFLVDGELCVCPYKGVRIYVERENDN